MQLLPRQYTARSKVSESWWDRMVVRRGEIPESNNKRDGCDPDEDDDCPPPSSSKAKPKTKIVCGQNGDDDDGEDCSSSDSSAATSTEVTSTSSSASTTTTTTSTSSTKSSVSVKETSTKTRSSSTVAKVTSSTTSLATSTSTSLTASAPTTSAAGAGISSVNASQGISGTTEAILIVLVVIGIIIILPMIFFFIRRSYKRRQLEKEEVRSAPATPLYRTSFSQDRASGYFPDAENMARAPQYTVSISPQGGNRFPAPLTLARPITIPRKAITSASTLVVDSDVEDPFADPPLKKEQTISERLPRARESEREFSRHNDSVTLVDMRPGGRWSDPFTVAWRGSGGADQPGNRWRSALSWVRDQRGRVNLDEDVERTGSRGKAVEEVSRGWEDGPRRQRSGREGNERQIYPGRGRRSVLPGGVI